MDGNVVLSAENRRNQDRSVQATHVVRQDDPFLVYPVRFGCASFRHLVLPIWVHFDFTFCTGEIILPSPSFLCIIFMYIHE